MPDWSARAAVAEYAAAGAEILGDDPAAARAERKWDRTPSTEPAVRMANQLRTVFAKLDYKPRWRERLSELATLALVVHGRRDPFFPVGNGEALTREIPGARCSCSNGPRRRSPIRPPVKSPRLCSRSERSKRRRFAVRTRAGRRRCRQVRGF